MSFKRLESTPVGHRMSRFDISFYLVLRIKNYEAGMIDFFEKKTHRLKFVTFNPILLFKNFFYLHRFLNPKQYPFDMDKKK